MRLETFYLKCFFILLVSGIFVNNKLVAQSPNVIFILVDDQRFDFLSFQGHPWIKTPNIDYLASNGIFFKNAFVTTSLCSPSRASIVTGQYAHTHGVKDNNTELPENSPNFPFVMKEGGYRTGFIGKWHMGGDNDNPRKGFDFWLSFKGQGEYIDPNLNINGSQIKKAGYMTDILTDYAVDFIEENAKKKKPYFLYLSHKAIHEPFTPAERHKGAYNGLVVPRPDTYIENEENYQGKPDWLKRQRNSWHGAERDFSIGSYGSFDNFFRLYSEAMLSIDDSVGTIINTLSKLNELENTVIIYYSDNGYMMGEHGIIDKRVMYEESIRVPAIVYWPKFIKSAKVKEEMILNIDIGPTVLDITGFNVPSAMHGFFIRQYYKRK